VLGPADSVLAIPGAQEPLLAPARHSGVRIVDSDITVRGVELIDPVYDIRDAGQGLRAAEEGTANADLVADLIIEYSSARDRRGRCRFK
jgi:hypothetical protein